MSQMNTILRSAQKHYSAQIDNNSINKDDCNSQKNCGVQPYQIQSRSISQKLINIGNSVNTRSASHKKSSFLTNSHQNYTDRKQTILKSTNSAQSRIPHQPSYSTLNQQQSTAVSSFLQYSNTNNINNNNNNYSSNNNYSNNNNINNNNNMNNQSQQLPFTTAQISQSLTGSFMSQSQLSRNALPKNTILSPALPKNKSSFLQYPKLKTSDFVSGEQNQQQNSLDHQGIYDQNTIAPLIKQESILWEKEGKVPNINISYNQKLKQSILIQNNQFQRDPTRQLSQTQYRFSSVDSKVPMSQLFLHQEQHRHHFYKPAPLQKQPKNTQFPPENLGDQQSNIQEESLTMNSLQQSAMIESAKISERSNVSFYIDIKRTRLTKRLLDLQEPRQIQEEDEEETATTTNCLDYKSDNCIERSNSTQIERNTDNVHKFKKYSCDIKLLSPCSIDMDVEIDTKDQNIEEFSPHQNPPSMASINNQQMNRDWNNSKSPKDRRVSLATTLSIENRIAQDSTNETLHSFYQNSKTPLISTPVKTQVKKLQPTQEIQELFENQNPMQIRDRRSSSTGNIAEIPDEPEKTQILRTFYMAGNRIPIVRLSQINKRFQPNGDRYFIPSLLKSIKGEKDKLSTLYKQYFQKMYFNFQINPKLENKYLSISPVFLPPLTTNKKTIFFDLDETLIHCIDIFTDPAQYEQFTQSNMTNKTSASTSRNSESCNEVLCSIQCSPLEKIQCLFSIRPYAIQILQELAKDFELILLTAARKIYADAVLEKLDPENKIFSHRFYRECCIEFSIPNPQQQQGSKKTYLKDLRVFQNRKLENVILVDNSPLSYLNQITNGIPILDYCNNNKNDDELFHLSSYLKSLLNVNDVRESIKQKFLLKQYRAFPSIESLQSYLLTEQSDSKI